MSMVFASTFALVNVLVQSAGAVAAALAAAKIAGSRERYVNVGPAIVLALLLTTVWCAMVAVSPAEVSRQGLLEALCNLGWLLVVYKLFAEDGRHTSMVLIRPVMLVLATLSVLHLGFELLSPHLLARNPASAGGELFRLTAILRLLEVIGGLVLLHNLYVGAAPQARLRLRWSILALAVLWGFDLNLYAIAYLGNSWPVELAALRGLIVVALSILVTLAGAKGQENLRFRPSRQVTFQSVSLLVIGGYLAAMIAGAQWLSYVGGNFSRLMQFGFLFAAIALALLMLPSRKLRSWTKVMLTKHLFQHRYDYRAEWMRFTTTMAKGSGPVLPLEERAVQAIADIADSPGGLLLLPSDNGDLILAARWQWPLVEVPAKALSPEAGLFFDRTGLIVDLDDLRAGKSVAGEDAVIPQWLRDDPRAWALVPLVHERLTGLVVLARPTPARGFDWEDFDLLRVAGQQLASYLTEHSLQTALAEASRFDDFHRRIAFVMHDIKNLASQLSLLVRNAELHAEKPEFRADMLVTLRNSAEKLNTLLARLSRYVSDGSDRVAAVDVAAVAQRVAAQFRASYPVALGQLQACQATANEEALEQVLVHLVQNAIDASAGEAPVVLALSVDGPHAVIEVVDSGSGMSPDFIRTKLFKPFVSTKQGGFGIGAFEASELVKAMRGKLDVESREGLGSRFSIRLPLADPDASSKIASEPSDLPAKKVA
jgi:putative PEP-CTERM system histidine kinase